MSSFTLTSASTLAVSLAVILAASSVSLAALISVNETRFVSTSMPMRGFYRLNAGPTFMTKNSQTKLTVQQKLVTRGTISTYTYYN